MSEQYNFFEKHLNKKAKAILDLGFGSGRDSLYFIKKGYDVYAIDPEKDFCDNAVKLGINTAFEDFAWNFGNLMLIRILNSINDLAAGIYSIVFSVEVLAVVVIASIGNGTMTIASEARGSKDLKMYKEICKISYALCVLVALIALGICIAFPDFILRMFTKDEGIIASCGFYLILVCINLFGKSANIIIGNGIRGSGNTVWMFATQLFGTVFIIGLASLFVYVFNMEIVGVFMAVIVDEIVRAFINYAKLHHIIKKWEQ